MAETAPDSATPANPEATTVEPSSLEADHAYLAEVVQRGFFGRLRGYVVMSGPGWLQSAITLGGGSLASSLILGIVAGYSMMWLQPLAMILGIIMLSAIGYVTLSTQERPFRLINEKVNPVLGWGWGLAVLAANIVWCLPQYTLAFDVMDNTLAPGLFGPGGSINEKFAEMGWMADNASKLFLAIIVLILCTTITWSYDRGGWGLKLYEAVLKVMVGLIVLCFIGVIVKLSLSKEGLPWELIAQGIIPNFSQFNSPAETYLPLLNAIKNEAARGYWTQVIIDMQQDVVIAAAATAVGINMTFLFPYSLLRKGWNPNYRGLTIFDLATGMFIPYVLATGCVVLASASQFHAILPNGIEVKDNQVVLGEKFQGKAGDYNKRLDARKSAANEELPKEISLAEQKLAVTLVQRESQHLATALEPLTGTFIAKGIFGFGVLAMTLSTVSILMLISGFTFTELLGYEPGGWVHRLGTLIAGVGGTFGPFVWGNAGFYLAIPTSVIGLMLLPIAYLTFFVLMNQKSILGDDMPRGARRFAWNTLMLTALSIASVAAIYSVNKKAGWVGNGILIAFIVLAGVVGVLRKGRTRDDATSPS